MTAKAASNEALLELHCAAMPFLNRLVRDDEARARLRRAVVQIMRERGAIVPPALVSSPEEALESLRGIVRRCIELKVNWSEVAAIVNRETVEA